MDDLIYLSRSDLQSVIHDEVQAAILRRSPQEETEKLFTANEACEILRCTKPTLHKWKAAGIIPHVKIGTNIRYRESDIKEMLTKSGRIQ